MLELRKTPKKQLVVHMFSCSYIQGLAMYCDDAVDGTVTFRCDDGDGCPNSDIPIWYRITFSPTDPNRKPTHSTPPSATVVQAYSGTTGLIKMGHCGHEVCVEEEEEAGRTSPSLLESLPFV